MKKVFSALKRSFSLSGSPEPDVRFAVDAPPPPPRKTTTDAMPPPPPPPSARLAMAIDDPAGLDKGVGQQEKKDAEPKTPKEKKEVEPDISVMSEQAAKEIQETPFNGIRFPDEVLNDPEVGATAKKNQQVYRDEHAKLGADGAKKARAIGTTEDVPPIPPPPEDFNPGMEAPVKVPERKPEEARKDLAERLRSKLDELTELEEVKLREDYPGRENDVQRRDDLEASISKLKGWYTEEGGDFNELYKSHSSSYAATKEATPKDDVSKKMNAVGETLAKQGQTFDTKGESPTEKPSKQDIANVGGDLVEVLGRGEDDTIRKTRTLNEDESAAYRAEQVGLEPDEYKERVKRQEEALAKNKAEPSSKPKERTPEEIAEAVDDAVVGTSPAAPKEKAVEAKVADPTGEDKDLPVIEADSVEPKAANLPIIEAESAEDKSDKYQAIPVQGIVDEFRKQGKYVEAEQYQLDREIAQEQKILQGARNSANKLAEMGAEQKLKELQDKRERLPQEVGKARRSERRENRRDVLRERMKQLEDDYWSGKADDDLAGNVEARQRIEDELVTIDRLEKADNGTAREQRPSAKKQTERTEPRKAAKQEAPTQETSGADSEQRESEPGTRRAPTEAPPRSRDTFAGMSAEQLERQLEQREKETDNLVEFRSQAFSKLKELEVIVPNEQLRAERFKGTFLRGRLFAWLAKLHVKDLNRAKAKYEGMEKRLRESVENRNKLVVVLENRLREQIVQPEEIAERTRANLEAAESLGQEELGALLKLENQLTNLEEAAEDPKRSAELMDRSWREQVERIRMMVLERRARVRENEPKILQLRSRLAQEQAVIDGIKEQVASYVRRSRLPDELVQRTLPPTPEEPATEPTEPPLTEPRSPEPATSSSEASPDSSPDDDFDDDEDEDDAFEDESEPRYPVGTFVERNNDYFRTIGEEKGPEITEEEFATKLQQYLQEHDRPVWDDGAPVEDMIGALREMYEDTGAKYDDAFWEKRKEQVAGGLIEPVNQ